MKSERAFWLLAIGIFALLVGVNYFPVFLGRIPFPRDMVLQFPPWAGFHASTDWQRYADIGDIVTSFYPFRAFGAQAVREGTIPLWNPEILLGAPFLANAQSALFYPPNFLYYVLPLPIAWTMNILLRMFLAGMFMTLFVRSIGGSRTGAILSGILFASCGFMTAWQGQAMGDAAIWLPMICYSVNRLRLEPSRRVFALTAVALAMPVLAGHPETAGHVTLAAMFLALVLWLSSAGPESKRLEVRFVALFAGAGVLALGLTAVQVLPTLEWLGELGYALQINWPTLPPHQALAFVSRDAIRSPNSAGIPIPEGAAYFGMIGLLAAALAPFHRAKRYVMFFGLLTFLALAIAYTIEPFHWLAMHSPILKGLKNGRLILVASFGLAGLGGLGISALEEDKTLQSIRRRPALLLTGAVLVVLFFMVYTLQRETGVRAEFFRRPSFSRALLFLSVIPIVWKLYGGLRGRAFPLVVCALAAFDLATFGYAYMGFAAPGEIYPPSPVFDFLKTQSDPARSRIMQLGTPGSPYPSNIPMMYGLTSADGYEVALFRARFFASQLSEDRLDGLVFQQANVTAFADRRLDLMNVKYIVHSPHAGGYEDFRSQDRFPLIYETPDMAVFENKSVLPRAFTVSAEGIEVLADPNAQLERLKDASFNPEQKVIVSRTPVFGSSSPNIATPNKTEIVSAGINEVAVHAEVSAPSVLVLSQTYYPGWKALVDGQTTEVFDADLLLTGVALSPGAHDVRFVFDPPSVRIGALLSLVSVIIIVGLSYERTRSIKGKGTLGQH
jgi:hypothetical protein